MDNPYEVLGVSKDATEKEIKKAFKQLTKKWHPDLNHEPGAEEHYKKVVSAYEILSDKDKRAQYDQYGTTDNQQMGNSGFYGANIDDIFRRMSQMGGFGFDDDDDMFSGFGFRNGFNQRTRGNMPINGNNLQATYSVSLKEIFAGKKDKISYSRKEKCSKCNGTGSKSGKRNTCPTCHGSGMKSIVHRQGNMIMQQQVVCPDCKGTGYLNTDINDKCNDCHGTGFRNVNETVEFEIVRGNYAPIIIPGKGEAGQNGGVDGSLIIQLDIVNDTKFIIQGLNTPNLGYILDCSYPQLVLGDTIKIDTLHGVKEVKIPDCAEPNSIITIKGAGMPIVRRTAYGGVSATDNYGDLLIKLKLVMPKSISDKERKLLEKLKK